MKTVDERMVEIFRRSQAVFEKRKERKKSILIATIPTVLCFTLVLSFIWFLVISAENGRKDSVGTSEISTRLASVEVIGSGVEFYYDQTEVLVSVERIFNDLTAIPNTDSKENDYISNGSSIGNGDFDEDADYRFVLTDTEGEVVEYLLRGSVFTDVSNNKKYIADGIDLALLLQVLGISFD